MPHKIANKIGTNTYIKEGLKMIDIVKKKNDALKNLMKKILKTPTWKMTPLLSLELTC